MKISVVIPTKNRCSLLRQAIISILKCGFNQENYEILVIDNDSTDETKKMVDGLIETYKHIKYVFEENIGLHSARNRAIVEAEGDIIAYIDDDVIVVDDWLNSICRVFSDSKVILATGECLPMYEEVPDYEESLWVEINKEIKYIPELSCIKIFGKNREIFPDCVFGCNFIIRKNILKEINGFHPDSMPEKYLMYRGDGETFVANEAKKRGLVVFDRGLSIYHIMPKERIKEQSLRKINYRNGISEAYIVIRNYGYMQALKSIVRDVYSFGRKKKNMSYLDYIRFLERINGKKYLLIWSRRSYVRRWIKQDNYMGLNGNINTFATKG